MTIVQQNQIAEKLDQPDQTCLSKAKISLESEPKLQLPVYLEIQSENISLKKQISQLQTQVTRLQQDLQQEQVRTQELQRIVDRLQNPHVPPSVIASPFGPKPSRKPAKKPFDDRKSDHDDTKPTRGREKGHPGASRVVPEPDEIIELTQNQCCHCQHELMTRDIIKTNRKITEEIPIPNPVKVIEYRTLVYQCPNCFREVKGNRPGNKLSSSFGPRVHSLIVFESITKRLPLRLVAKGLESQFNLTLTPTSVLSALNRVATILLPEYQQLINRIYQSPVVYIDETSFKVKKENWWVWIFTTPKTAVFLFHPSRGREAPEEVLGNTYQGTIVSDGWTAYKSLNVPHFQRCWAHLIRYFEAAAPLNSKADDALEKLRIFYHDLKEFVNSNPTKQERQKKHTQFLVRLEKFITEFNAPESTDKLQKAIKHLANGMPNWLTCVLIPGVEPTNNRAERDLRDVVILRKIKQSLQTERSAETLSILLSLEMTADLNGVNFLDYLYDILNSEDPM